MEATNSPKAKEATMNQSQLEAAIAEMDAEYAATLAAVPTMRTLQSYRTGFGGELIVNSISYAVGTDLQSVIDHTAMPQSVTLTEDGRSANTAEWHDGHEAESVYVERWTPAGRVFHGYVDSVSRKVVQTG